MDEGNKILVVKDDLSDGNIVRLLQIHRQEMLKHSPAKNVHALDVHQLYSDQIQFWSAWVDGGGHRNFAGCGGLKDLGGGHGELKSMKTADRFLRRGVAQSLLTHILDSAQKRGFQKVSLETGTQLPFHAAHQLYLRNGFRVCDPFADYTQSDISTCMTKEL